MARRRTDRSTFEQMDDARKSHAIKRAGWRFVGSVPWRRPTCWLADDGELYNLEIHLNAETGQVIRIAIRCMEAENLALTIGWIPTPGEVAAYFARQAGKEE